MSEVALPNRVLITHTGAGALDPRTRSMMAKLGYAILEADEFEPGDPAHGRERPDLRIVDERNLADVPDEDRPALPIVVITGRHGVTGADPRIVGALRRPAGVHELYRLVQQVLEDSPRATPRVPTHLPALCEREGREWRAAVLSLSENGCLLRSPEPLLLGSRLTLRFELPRSGTVETEAEVAYQLVPDAGLIFHATSPLVRESITRFVLDALHTP